MSSRLIQRMLGRSAARARAETSPRHETPAISQMSIPRQRRSIFMAWDSQYLAPNRAQDFVHGLGALVDWPNVDADDTWESPAGKTAGESTRVYKGLTIEGTALAQNHRLILIRRLGID